LSKADARSGLSRAVESGDNRFVHELSIAVALADGSRILDPALRRIAASHLLGSVMATLGVRVGLAWVLALACADAGHGDCPPPTDAEHRQAGLEAFRAGEEALAGDKWDEAAERFAAAVHLDPLLPLALYGLGQAQMGAKRYADAVQAFAACREAFRCLASASARAHADAQKQVDGAIRELRDVLRNVEREEMVKSGIPRKEANGLPSTNLADAILQAQKIEDVLRELEGWKRQLALADVPAEVLMALGNAYFQSGSLADAEREYLGALRTNPKLADVQNNLAVVYMLTGRLDEAEQALKRAEKAGVPVSPRLRGEIRKRREGNLPHP
jgi:tetratricopeptide (TPR) repeat protein